MTLADIMTEKYIALFQNTEVWNDWKRTCLPALTPAQGTVGGIPGAAAVCAVGAEHEPERSAAERSAGAELERS